MNGDLNNAGIYQFRISRPEGYRFYIGHAASLRKRRNDHLSSLRRGVHKNARMQRAFSKYGENAFSFEVLLVCEKSAKALEMYEKRIIDRYHPRHHLYNICLDCVGSKLGVRQSAEHRAKIGSANKGRKPSASCIEAVKKGAKKRIGRKYSPERIAKGLATKRANAERDGYWTNPASVAKMAKTLTGRKLSVEHRSAISRGHIGQVGHWKGKRLSESHRANVSRGLREKRYGHRSNGDDKGG
jgi:group I intron endonuclease